MTTFRKTKNFIRERLEKPSDFAEFRVKKIGHGKEIIVGRLKHSHKWRAQAILSPRK